MGAALVLDAAHLDDPQSPSLDAELLLVVREADDTVGDAVELRVALVGGLVVEQQHGALALREEVLQRQDLPAVAQRLVGEQPHFREAVEHHARRG